MVPDSASHNEIHMRHRKLHMQVRLMNSLSRLQRHVLSPPNTVDLPAGRSGTCASLPSLVFVQRWSQHPMNTGTPFLYSCLILLLLHSTVSSGEVKWCILYSNPRQLDHLPAGQTKIYLCYNSGGVWCMRVHVCACPSVYCFTRNNYRGMMRMNSSEGELSWSSVYKSPEFPLKR